MRPPAFLRERCLKPLADCKPCNAEPKTPQGRARRLYEATGSFGPGGQKTKIQAAWKFFYTDAYAGFI